MTTRFFLLFLYPLFIFAFDGSQPLLQHREALYSRISPSSVRQLLLFASLYPDTKEGADALRKAWSILSTKSTESTLLPLDFEKTATSLIALVDPSAFQNVAIPSFDKNTIALLESMGSHLPTRRLKGHEAKTLEDIDRLDSSEIDIARALLLLQEQPMEQILVVEAALDLMAVEILSKIGPSADPFAKISAINTLLFYDLGIRFPPEEEVAVKTAQFSQLSSVLFSRRGVCLGSSVLYMSLAQRLELPLSIYTPPGHIFVAYKDRDFIRVIETTARGIDLPIETYLGLTLKHLTERPLKEVVGMVAFNSAAPFLKNKDWKKALSTYQTAFRFEKGYEVVQMMSLCELLLGHRNISQELARRQIKELPPERLEHDLLLMDLSKGFLTPTAAEAILEYADAEGEELPKAITRMQEEMKLSPESWTLPFHLAHNWLSYGKPKEAIPLLEQLSAKPDATCTIHALLAMLYQERYNFPKAWEEIKKAVTKAKRNGAIPRTLRQLILSFQSQSPNNQDVPSMLK